MQVLIIASDCIRFLTGVNASLHPLLFILGVNNSWYHMHFDSRQVFKFFKGLKGG